MKYNIKGLGPILCKEEKNSRVEKGPHVLFKRKEKELIKLILGKAQWNHFTKSYSLQMSPDVIS